MKKYIFIVIILLTYLTNVFSQEELLSAKELMEKLSERFKTSIKDYEADIKWTQANKEQKGTLFFKNPQKMRINFSDPANQVICTNGYELWVFIPFLNLTLHQVLLTKQKTETEEGTLETVVNPILLNPVGLDGLINGYSIEFHETKKKVPYKDGTMVYQLKLIRWRSSKSGFNVLYIMVQENGIIRRVEGITAAYRKVILEVDNVEINKGVSDLFFNYNPPSHSSTVEDFITKQGK